MTPVPGGTPAVPSLLAGRRPTWIEIDLQALAANFRSVATACGGAPIWAVVKADAYGHGAIACSRVLEQEGVAGLVVALPEEGMALRRAGLTTPILLSGPLPVTGVDTVLAHDITPSISRAADLHHLEAAARQVGKPAPYHLELDTGMARMGLPPEALPAFLETASRASHCRMTAVMSHLASVREPAGATARAQHDLFRRLVAKVREATGTAVPCQLAASPAVCHFPESHLDAVRPGILLYGVRPEAAMDCNLDLQPVLAMHSAVILVRRIAAGTAVGYDGTYQAPTDTHIAMLAAGYGDGLRRDVAGVAEALVDGRRLPYVGAVNMDLAQLRCDGATEDLTHQVATIVGAQGRDRITIEELAAATGRTTYEWLTGLGGRVPRIFLGADGPFGPYTPTEGDTGPW